MEEYDCSKFSLLIKNQKVITAQEITKVALTTGTDGIPKGQQATIRKYMLVNLMILVKHLIFKEVIMDYASLMRKKKPE